VLAGEAHRRVVVALKVTPGSPYDLGVARTYVCLCSLYPSTSSTSMWVRTGGLNAATVFPKHRAGIRQPCVRSLTRPPRLLHSSSFPTSPFSFFFVTPSFELSDSLERSFLFFLSSFGYFFIRLSLNIRGLPCLLEYFDRQSPSRSLQVYSRRHGLVLYFLRGNILFSAPVSCKDYFIFLFKERSNKAYETGGIFQRKYTLSSTNQSHSRSEPIRR
jgi:hypothetical protein